jgi:deoxyribodipyrimidine photo-lyase
MKSLPVIVWFRHDLRLADNPALNAACTGEGTVIPLFILEDQQERTGDPECLGGASRWWLHHSLLALAESLAPLGLNLVLRRGTARKQLEELIRETGARTVHWNRRYEPTARNRDLELEEQLRVEGIRAQVHPGNLMTEPWEMSTGQGKPYQVFTPFYRRFRQSRKVAEPLPIPSRAQAQRRQPASLALDELRLKPTRDWADGLAQTWNCGEIGARKLWQDFKPGRLGRYLDTRDLPGSDGTSRLSPHFHFGEISPRQVWHEALNEGGEQAESFLRQLVWREFAHHLLHHFPHTTDNPLKESFESFPWDGDPDLLRAWQKGQTGYPLVDAGMRQLWHTGWMHNRVRMVAASFLVKHLLLPWQLGAAWFQDTLVDADTANNTFGWQWVAGCGADAAPFFRIFNPILQGRKFDKNGQYIRQWVPELSNLPDKLLHEPWTASPEVLESSGVKLGVTYPLPVINHKVARQRALDSYSRMRAG